MIRRTFLAGIGSISAALTSAFPASAQSALPVTPRRHEQDDWLDEAPRGHRAVFDTWLADKVGETLGFTGNWVRINKDQYGLTDGDLGVVIVLRHGSAPFAFNEAIWTKYGAIFAANMSANDKVAHPNPSANVQADRLRSLAKQGVRLAVCNLTTRAYAQMIAKEKGITVDAVLSELTGNTVVPATFVPAGIVTVTRAQERGYALVSVG